MSFEMDLDRVRWVWFGILVLGFLGEMSLVEAQCNVTAEDGAKYSIPQAGPFELTGTTGEVDYTYVYMICAELPRGCKMVLGQVLCQEWGDRGTTEQIYCGKFGTQAVVPIPGGKGVALEYSGGLGGRTATVAVLCDPQAEQPTRGEIQNPGIGYQISVFWKHGCPLGHKGSGGGKKGGLSGGSILLICLLCVTVTYFVAGTLFNKYQRHREGSEIIPNRDFWIGIPGLVKDGVVFTYHKVRGQSNSNSNSYQGIR